MGLPNQRWQHESSVCGSGWKACVMEKLVRCTQSRSKLMCYNYHDRQKALCSVRLSVRTLPFHGRKRSSILLSCTIFNYIGLPDPVGCMSIGCLDEDGCVMLSRKMETKWSLHARRCWYGNSSSLGSLECNVRCDQSLDDSVVSHRVMIVADHPSVIKYDIGCLVP